MWGQYHPIPYQSKLKEKFLGPLSFGETIWMGIGAVLSYQMTKFIPPIGSDIIFSRIHYFIPLALTWYLAYGKHPTGFTIGKYLIMMILIRLRNRKYLYRRVNIKTGGDH
ncbi:hypothetical protein [Chengkuizengella sediminis]|uniref:hypothetical protein n=1 Tax=Chengkuizengella sediminis TaxID=1885917 RepID=UPI001389893A|nr:hypothetical protein [Chengkuizengella sediminis]NDI36654.1 hypothetical protein [Chengkuizengella sediminis]